MMRALKGAVCGLAMMAGLPAFAQDQQSLADIRSELAQLSAQVQGLRQELVSSGSSGLQAAGGASALARMDTMEASLSRLTSQTEELQNKINRVVSDGTNRIGDLEFRVCEMEQGCDISSIGKTAPLGGADSSAAAAPTPAASSNGSGQSSADLAMNEQSDFDRAKGVLDQGDFPRAAKELAAFAQSYTGGPLSDDALYYQGEALQKSGDTAGAARAWLNAFSTYPDGDKAPESLTKLGWALGQLGQRSEACTALGQVGQRYPQAQAVSEARAEMSKLGCM
ncbi:tol-pal system protein YbgF [Thioclava sp. GXIMD4216]|uniref:Cell division coordinator CpoB n=1 Tax=Thioclava litoralis TaxID=3076557 RepID=A0ABZ1E2J3_9RHOB|nr:tol-pal system protein YbgF [Thioclava sp. FTW29]